MVRSIKYEGSEIGDRLGNPGPVQGAQGRPCPWNRSTIPTRFSAPPNVLKEYLAERGRQFATVEPEIRQIPPSSLEVTFNVNEGPKVKVGEIDIEGNTVFSDRAVIRAMKNLQPDRHPALHSAREYFCEDLRFDQARRR